MGIWFFSSLAGGMLAILACCRPDQVAWKFLCLIGVLSLAMLCGTLAWYVRAHAWGESVLESTGALLLLVTAVLSGVLIGVAPLVTTRSRLFRAVIWPASAAGLAASCIWAGLQEGINFGANGQTVILLLGQLSSAVLMGAVTVAWLLGHAYLTATRMTIAPLRRLSVLLVLALAIRILVSIGGVTAATAGGAMGVAELGRHWMLLSLRGGVGLLLPAVFVYMVYDCVRLRSTQSATGILYFASPFIYVGELCSLIATGEFGWPV